MKRYATAIEDGTLYVETDDGRTEVGTMDQIEELVGGETFDIEYERRHAALVDWVETDESGVLTIDVREELADMSYPAAFVEKLQDRDGDDRTEFFADSMATVWESKGNLDDDDNPFR
jgi:DNA-dependent RNA polymerase auxiliary subunit epsilon